MGEIGVYYKSFWLLATSFWLEPKASEHRRRQTQAALASSQRPAASSYNVSHAPPADYRTDRDRAAASALYRRPSFLETGVTLPLLVVIPGPTGSGKTSLAIALAERLAGEIVSCDSVAVYREFEIGTAKPSPEERARVPHHLIDVVSPLEVFTAGDYSRLARTAIQEISSAGHLPIVAGGTGLYLRALIDGLFAGPQRSEELRQRLRARAAGRGPQYLHKILARLDAPAAAAIHPNDLPKLVRAVEVCLSARGSMTEMWRQGRDALTGFRVLRIGLQPEREALYQRINARARRMFDRGLVEETRDLMRRHPEARPLESLGYKQAVQYLRGELALEQAIALAQQGHRNFAKRQLTWFRREPDVQWLAGFGDDTLVQRQCLALVSAEEEASGS